MAMEVRRDTIDLRSDTVTRPTQAMRQAIGSAVVGDAALGDDPTVQRLEDRMASLLGMERALFFPTGIMANQSAVLCQTEPGTEVVVEGRAHILDWEDGAAAHWSGVQLRPVPTPDGRITADHVESGLRRSTSLVCLENTHNAAGGRVQPLERLREIRDLTAARGVPVHLDGARLWNASTATGTPVDAFAAQVDSVMVTLSKGLGAPVGSMLAGSEALIDRAHRIRRRFGGGMRQTGILAAAGLHALEHHRDRLADDHANARLLARRIDEIPGARVVEPETNIVMVDLESIDIDAADVAHRLDERGVRVSIFGPHRLRAVTHLDVDKDAIRRAADVFAEVLGRSEARSA